MVKDIVTDLDQLKLPAQPATAEDASVVQDLFDTMDAIGSNCACLAANQIGVNKAIIAYEEDGEYFALFNPVLTKGFIPYTAHEACFSLPYDSEIRRFKRALVSFEVLKDGQLVPRQRKFTDWTAEIVQHGIDHCNGVLV
jgi:peptide deformylase